MLLCCLRCALKPSASATSAFSKLCQHCRVRGHPCGLQDALSTLRPSCSPLSRLRHGRKTRYGWVANPYPTRTLTLQETPSLSWRDNAGRQAPPIAAARHERRLLAVACTPLIMIEASPSVYPSGMLSLVKSHSLKRRRPQCDSTPISTHF